MDNSPEFRLTSKEKEVLHLLTLGRTNKQIATALGVSPETVKMSLKYLFRKLRVKNRTAAAITAIQKKLI